MMSRRFLIFSLLLLGILGFQNFGQTQPPPLQLPSSIQKEQPRNPAPMPLLPASGDSAMPIVPPVLGSANSTAAKRSAVFFYDQYRATENFGELTLQTAKTARVGMDWLNRMAQSNGLFLPGYNPALNRPLPDDNLVHQAAAAFGLAHAAKATGNGDYTARASFAILKLLIETQTPSPGIRVPNNSKQISGRLAFAGVLIRAIYALPDPAEDLMAKAEELALFIRSQQQPDGSLREEESSEGSSAAGMALYGLAASLKAKPAEWKSSVLRSACTYYRNAMRGKPAPAAIVWMAPAFAEAFQQTRETAFAEFVFEMNDWLCTLQYSQIDAKHESWYGGFRFSGDPKSPEAAPGTESALAIISLAEGYRTLKMLQNPDASRLEKYKTALNRAVLFVNGLQYSQETTGHFETALRAFLSGSFHLGPLSGDIRIDQSALVCTALTQYLACGADR